MKLRMAAAAAVVLASLACGVLTQPSAPTPDQGAVATAVAATLAAQSTSTPPDIPTAILGPTPLPPTATPAPQPERPRAVLQLAYTDENGNIFLWAEDNGITQLTFDGGVMDLKLSPDGRYIAYVRDVGYPQTELRVVRLNDGDDRLLVDASQFQALITDEYAVGVVVFRFEWLPGAPILLYNTAPVFAGPGAALNQDLWLVDVGSGEPPRALLEAGQGGDFVISPDGTQLALITPESISLANIDGSNVRRNVLVFPLVLTYSEYNYYPRPLWAADGSHLLVVIPPAESLAEPPQPTTIWRIPTDGSPAEMVAQILAAPFFTSQVLISPDLTKMLFARPVGEPEANQNEIVVANVDGSDEVVYARPRVLSGVFGWAPDSLRFLYWVESGDNLLLGQVGQEPVSLSDTGRATGVRWLDERRFFFLNRVGDVWEVRLGEAGGASRVLATVRGLPPLYDFAP